MRFEEEAKRAIKDEGLAHVQHEFMSWAFGPDYDGELIRNLRTRWNTRHGDLFDIDGLSTVYENFCDMAHAYKKRND